MAFAAASEVVEPCHEPYVVSQLDKWEAAKRSRDFVTADAIRDHLRSKGVDADLERGFRGKGSSGKGSSGKGRSCKDGRPSGPCGPNLAREVVIAGPVIGEVLEWNRVFGWIRPSERIDLPEAARRGGKLYVHKQDLVDSSFLERGTRVKFAVFKDASGLGAQDVSWLYPDALSRAQEKENRQVCRRDPDVNGRLKHCLGDSTNGHPRHGGMCVEAVPPPPPLGPPPGYHEHRRCVASASNAGPPPGPPHYEQERRPSRSEVAAWAERTVETSRYVMIVSLQRQGLTDERVKQWCVWASTNVKRTVQTGRVHALDIDASFNEIGDTGCKALAELLVDLNLTLRSLKLFNNRIADGGAEALSLLINRVAIHELHLSHNDIGHLGFVKLLMSIAWSSRGALATYPLQEDAPRGLKPMWLQLNYNRLAGTEAELVERLEEATTKIRQIRCDRGFLDPSSEAEMICDAPKPGCNSSCCSRCREGLLPGKMECPVVHLPWIMQQHQPCEQNLRQEAVPDVRAHDHKAAVETIADVSTHDQEASDSRVLDPQTRSVKRVSFAEAETGASSSSNRPSVKPCGYSDIRLIRGPPSRPALIAAEPPPLPPVRSRVGPQQEPPSDPVGQDSPPTTPLRLSATTPPQRLPGLDQKDLLQTPEKELAEGRRARVVREVLRPEDQGYTDENFLILPVDMEVVIQHIGSDADAGWVWACVDKGDAGWMQTTILQPVF